MTRRTPPATVAVTDQAVVRYLEQVWGVDVAAIRSRIAREAATGVAHGAAALGRGRVRFVLDSARVVTVTPRAALPTLPREP